MRVFTVTENCPLRARTHTRRYTRMKVHLSGDSQATACGQNASYGVPEAKWEDADKVTCQSCRKTKLFARLKSGDK